MSKKSKIKIITVCEKCDEAMPKDEEKSNENWEVFQSECKCGGRATATVYEKTT